MKYIGTILNSFRNVSRAVEQEFRVLEWKGLKKIGLADVTVSTKQGRFTVNCSDDAIGQQLFCHREFESTLNKNVIRFLRSREILSNFAFGTFLDIGANIGITSISMLKYGYFQKAIAIEPDPENFRLLEKNSIQNHLNDSIICKQYAASSMEGNVPFELSDSNLGDHRIRGEGKHDALQDIYSENTRKVISVKAIRVDDLLLQIPSNFVDSIGLLWVDTQGHEGYVFQGAEKLLARKIPVVAEITPYLIQRSGMRQKEFTGLVQEYWNHFFVLRSTRIGIDRFVQFPIAFFEYFYEALGYDGDYEEVIFLNCDRK